MAIKTILSITPAIFTGPTPCFAISCLTRRELTALIIFPNSTHFVSFPSIISDVSVFFTIKLLCKPPNINSSVSPRLESNFIDSYCVLLEFEKRASVNMQEINLKFWIMGCTTEGAKFVLVWSSLLLCFV